MWPRVISLLVLSLVWELQATQETLTQDDLIASLLGDDTSPPLSEEDGLTILGTGPISAATTLNCHRRLYSYKVGILELFKFAIIN